MPARHDNLYHRIATFAALKRAARKAIRSKRTKPGAAAFQFGLERELLRLERELSGGSYKPGRYIEIELTKPKHRLVSAAPFRDRVVHHALIDVVGPIFEAGFIGNTFANRKGKGTHKAIEAYEWYRDRYAYVLRCDIYRYFPSIDHAILKADFRRRIACRKTIWLMDRIVDFSNLQEPVYLHFSGDDLLSPLERRRGLPIGNLTSQFGANLYLDGFDHFCTEALRAPYVRYVDDFALFHDDPAVLAEWGRRIARFLDRRRLKLHPRKTLIASTGEPAEFLGFVLHAGGKRSLPEMNIAAFNGRLKGMLEAVRRGALDPRDAETKIAAWCAHADHAHARALKRSVLGGAMNGERGAGPGLGRTFARTV